MTRRVAMIAAALLASACSGDEGAKSDPFVPETLGRCAHFDPLRQPFFGDTHIHTAYSLDAGSQGTRLTPWDAYRFAKGEPLGVQPYDADGRALRTLSLDRPLDFAALSDHAEFLGEVTICETPELDGYDSSDCMLYRENPRAAYLLFNFQLSAGNEEVQRLSFCGEDGAACVEASGRLWEDIQRAAEAHYDRSDACGFTTFTGYEWSGSPLAKNLHRNVIFRNSQVPERPVSYFDEPEPEGLWDELDAHCLEGLEHCDVLTIPHNSNLSAGLMFEPVQRDGRPFDAAYAARRAAFEPLIEIFQHKGDSECLPGAGVEDELCGFEKLPFDNLAGNQLDFGGPPAPTDFVRAALKQGLAYWQTLGTDPFAYGIIASTDSHLGTPGYVDERAHPGHGGAGPAARDALGPGLPDYVGFNPGGLAVLWAEENSREALFEAMRRKEAYGTSGPRIVLRFFGGWAYPEALCEAEDFVAQGYAMGVPMGGELLEASGQAPRFAVWALRDPGSARAPGAPLQRLQIIKGWVEDGELRERVFEVAGDPDNGAGVDEATCAASGEGFDSLCEVFEDPDFDPAQPAFYYARAVENPTCRWSTRLCNEAGVDCSAPEAVPEALLDCCDPQFERVIQERAWSSPIWYRPR